MSKILLIGKVLLFVILVGFLLYVVKYAPDIRMFFSNGANKRVMGARTSFESDVRNDLEDYFNTAKEQILNVKIKDIVSPVMRMQKISKDLKGARNEIEGGVKEILK